MGPPPGPAPEQPPPPAPRPEPAVARAPKYEPRPDGGFGPMGSGGRTASSGRSSYSGRNANQWLMVADEEKESDSRNDVSSGRYRQGDGADAAPQFLIEADDLYDEDYGEGRLVAPPVLGEAPPSFRDF